MILVNTGKAVAGGAVYTGPGDVVSGATAWWGLRAYTAANATSLSAALDVYDTATGTIGPTTIHLQADGHLNPSEIPGYACSVSKLYDQTSTGNHLLQTTHANRPSLTTTGVMRLELAASVGTYLISGNYTRGTPFTVSVVAQHNSDTSGTDCKILRNNNSGEGFQFTHQSGGTNTKASATFGGGAVNSSVVTAFSTAIAVQILIASGANSAKILVTGTQDVGTTAGGFAADPIALLSSDADPSAFTEGGFWPGDQSAFWTGPSGLENNQRTFWGI